MPASAKRSVMALDTTTIRERRAADSARRGRPRSPVAVRRSTAGAACYRAVTEAPTAYRAMTAFPTTTAVWARRLFTAAHPSPMWPVHNLTRQNPPGEQTGQAHRVEIEADSHGNSCLLNEIGTYDFDPGSGGCN